jgi:uncharacterized protein
MTTDSSARIALVTGATAGIGAAFARRLAADGWNLVVVARDETRLGSTAAELRSLYSVDVEILPADLATDAGCALVEQRLAGSGRPLDLLVNNAGFGVEPRFVDGSVADEERMLRVMVLAVMRTSHAAATAMATRRRGAIINVSSVASFLPRNTYAATKSWVTSFSEGLAGELNGTGVRVQALCPGFVRTEFHERGGIDTTTIPSWLWLRTDDVVAASLADLARNVVVSVPSLRYKAVVALARHLPHSVIARVDGMLLKSPSANVAERDT